MGDRATIAFCDTEGTERARIYVHNDGGRIDNVMVRFFTTESDLAQTHVRDLRWWDAPYLAARFVAWYSQSDGLGIGIIRSEPDDADADRHWRIICTDPDVRLPEAWPQVRRVSPAPVETTNDFLFGIRGTGDEAVITPTLPVGPMDRGRALRAAAWLACIADPGGDEFAAVLEAVKST